MALQVAYVPLLNLKYHLCTTALNKPSMARHPTMSTHVLSNLPMSHPRLKLYGCFEQNTCTGYHYEPDIDYNNFSIVVTKNINFFRTNTTKQKLFSPCSCTTKTHTVRKFHNKIVQRCQGNTHGPTFTNKWSCNTLPLHSRKKMNLPSNKMMISLPKKENER